jgi:hypothetical protein
MVTIIVTDNEGNEGRDDSMDIIVNDDVITMGVGGAGTRIVVRKNA